MSIDTAIEDLKEQHEKEIQQLNEELDGYKNSNTDLGNEKNELKTQNRHLEGKIRELETLIEELKSGDERILVGTTAEPTFEVHTIVFCYILSVCSATQKKTLFCIEIYCKENR